MQGYRESKFIGHLTRDPESKQVAGHHLCEFSIAVNQKYKQKDIVNYFDFKAWGKLANIIMEYTKKGQPVFVVASPDQERWQDAQTGKARSRVVFTAQQIRLLGFQQSENQSAPAQQQPQPQPQTQQQASQHGEAYDALVPEMGYETQDHSDLPFDDF
jgi:single stranded DNA-binding protein